MRPYTPYITSTPPSPFTGRKPIPADRIDRAQLAAVADAVRAGASTLAGSGLTGSVASGAARQHRDSRVTARVTAQPTTSTEAEQAARPPRRLRKQRRAVQPFRPGLAPVTTSTTTRARVDDRVRTP